MLTGEGRGKEDTSKRPGADKALSAYLLSKRTNKLNFALPFLFTEMFALCLYICLLYLA